MLIFRAAALLRPGRDNISLLLRGARPARFAPGTCARRDRDQAALQHARCIASAPDRGASVGAVFTHYTIYKGSAAVACKVIKPRWKHAQDVQYIALDRQGVLLLEFASSTGQDRRYDWDNKVSFALSPKELADLAAARFEGGQELKFFHDPDKMGSTEGQVTKQLRVSRAERGFFFSLAIKERGAARNVSVSVDEGEMHVLRTLANYLIPRLLGFDELFHYPPDHAISEVGSNGYGGGTGAMEPPF